jgi:hypothetical protein
MAATASLARSRYPVASLARHRKGRATAGEIIVY